MEPFKRLTEAGRKERLRSPVAAHDAVRMNSSRQQIELIKPGRICDRQIVPDPSFFSKPEAGSVPALAGLLPNPPPQVLGFQKAEGK